MPILYPRLSAPVDGPFYISNAERGYQWQTRDYLSLWFHPLLSVLLRLCPNVVGPQIWFWLLSLVFSFGCLVATIDLCKILLGLTTISTKWMILVLIAPGGLNLIPGTAESATLFFSLVLILSIVRRKSVWVTLLSAAFAILTKPNALYMLPVLLVYLLYAIRERDKPIIVRSTLGFASILLVWGGWILFVDWSTGVPGSYWSARDLASQYASGNISGFFEDLAKAFLYTHNLRDQLRYSSALIIPTVNLWLVALVPRLGLRERYAFAGANLLMFGLALLSGNPNKIVVYTATIPFHFIIHMLLLQSLLKNFSRNWVKQTLIALPYLTYCMLVTIFYGIGTGLGWYY